MNNPCFHNLGRVGLGIKAQTAHRTIRASLLSYGSSHPNGFNRLGLALCCQWYDGILVSHSYQSFISTIRISPKPLIFSLCQTEPISN